MGVCFSQILTDKLLSPYALGLLKAKALICERLYL